MNKISNQELCIDIIHRIDIVNNEAKSLLELDPILLNTSPAMGKWSVNQCFAHLNLTLEYYLMAIEKGLNQAKGSNIIASEYFEPGFIGNWFYHKMMPITLTSKAFKIKTFSKLQPAENLESIPKFLDLQDQFSQYVRAIPNQNLEKTRVISLAGPLVKFKLGDAYRIVTGHNERHLLQSQNVIKEIQ
jgi:hypothetical protein